MRHMCLYYALWWCKLHMILCIHLALCSCDLYLYYLMYDVTYFLFFFFFKATAPPEILPLSPPRPPPVFFFPSRAPPPGPTTADPPEGEGAWRGASAPPAVPSTTSTRGLPRTSEKALYLLFSERVS